ncbi:MAG: Asp-tRNA(Asn)/Glu-tRNA(Gln) amidotransferase subunit GatA [Treponemataceae bacterium]|nr:MAG: Asp-tRNA(Asn)/Glu-tRNA(Gln) amidotransferase subunit GatA [Treponemataceae bacterium]
MQTMTIDEAFASYAEDKKSKTPLNAFLELYADAPALAKSANSDNPESPEKPLAGITFAVKDNISVKGKNLTCGSRILEGYKAPYSATVIERLTKSGAVPLGRCNMDEFAMGSSTEYSVYGPTRNPVNREYVSGGSSGGPAAAVAAGLVTFGLGTETGGSVRLPASYCGIYGLKTSYGVLSRWGVVAYGSSLDQVGILARTVDDVALPLFVMSGKDFYDGTSEDLPQKDALQNMTPLSEKELSALRIAIPRQFIEAPGLDAEVAAVFAATQQKLADLGACIDIVDIPVLDAAVASYYVIAFSEAASNLSRFDGIRYGKRLDPGEGFDELYVKTRSEGFGAEVKRRIIIGNYVLSEQFSGDCYKKAMSVRAKIQKDIACVFSSGYDIILCPTCPTPPFKIGQKVDDPLEMYLTDLYTTFVNLSRIPSLSIPSGFTQAGLPVGIQMAGSMFSEVQLLRIAKALE